MTIIRYWVNLVRITMTSKKKSDPWPQKIKKGKRKRVVVVRKSKVCNQIKMNISKMPCKWTFSSLRLAGPSHLMNKISNWTRTWCLVRIYHQCSIRWSPKRWQPGHSRTPKRYQLMRSRLFLYHHVLSLLNRILRVYIKCSLKMKLKYLSRCLGR